MYFEYFQNQVNMFDALDEINDKHMAPWADLCQNNDITNTPLTPFMDEELLYHKHLHLDNAKLKATGYKLQHPNMTRELIEEVYYIYLYTFFFYSNV